MNQIITFSAELTADAANRTISGKIVPLNVEAGSTNMGKVIFESGSIEIADANSIRLLSQHDNKKPLGKMLDYSESEDAINAVFSVINTSLLFCKVVLFRSTKSLTALVNCWILLQGSNLSPQSNVEIAKETIVD